MALPAFVFGNFRGGMQDRKVLRLPFSYCREIENMVVERGSLLSRGGIATRFNTALGSGTPIQGLYQYEDNSEDRSIIVACYGKLYRDDMDGVEPGTHDITGTVTLSTSQDARFVFGEYDGACWGTDGVNVPFKIASQSANAVKITDLTPDAPGRASAMAFFKERLVYGNYKDFDAAASNKPWGTIYSEPMRSNALQFLATEGARNDYNRKSHIVAIAVPSCSEDALLAFFRRGIRYLALDTATDLAVTAFSYRPVDSRVGLAAAYGVKDTPRGTFFVDNPGLYLIEPGFPPPKPKFIGKPVEDFWSDVRDARLAYACMGEFEESNGILLCVPWGASQSDNNRAVYLNYESWADEGMEADDPHPAMSIFKGTGADYAFNCLATITDTDSRRRLIGGGYDGLVYTLDQGVKDAGQGFTCRFVLPRVGDAVRESAWQELILDIDRSERKTLTVTQRNYEEAVPATATVSGGTSGVLLDEFMLDVDVLAGDTLGPMRVDLCGEARYTEIEVSCATLPLAIYGAAILYEPGDTL